VVKEFNRSRIGREAMYKNFFSIVLMLVIFLNNPLVIFAQSLNKVEIPEGLIGGMGFIQIPFGDSGESRYLLLGNQSQMWVTRNSIWITKIEFVEGDFLNLDKIITQQKRIIRGCFAISMFLLS